MNNEELRLKLWVSTFRLSFKINKSVKVAISEADIAVDEFDIRVRERKK